ncbi:MAG: biopolymer transporter ExbD, partial [Candidatus Cloacimonadaceae bacterium]|nr:biopolymer transporter ExbD [Candidatus Cloacimonadaceae bacterium]
QLSKKKISTTLLISMTDVIFLLIIFLLIASSFASQTGLPVRLPGSVSSVRQTHQVVHVVFLDEQNVSFDGKIISLAELGAALRDSFVSTEQVVRLSADKETALQTLISLMDTIRGAGYEKIFVATESKK